MRESHSRRRERYWPSRKFVRLFGMLLVSGSLITALVGADASRAQSPGASGATSQAAAAPDTASLRQAPNSRVALVLPPSYQPARLYSGFENEHSGISFVIFEAPRKAFDEMKGAFTPQSLAERGLTDGLAGQLDRRDEHIYMRARQASAAGTYAKFFVLFHTDDQTVLVSANVPLKALESGSTRVESIEAVLASAETVAATQIKELYRLGYLGPFKEAGRIAGTSKLYTLDGRLEPEHKGQSRPSLIIAPSIDKRPIADVAATAKTLMQTLAGYRDIATGVPELVTVSGLKGVTLEGTARDSQSGAAIIIHQLLLVAADGGYYRLVGLLPQEDAGRLLSELQRITQSFQLLDG